MEASHNGELTISQRAMLAADDVRTRGWTNEYAAAYWNVGKTSVAWALTVHKRNVSVASEVRVGKITLKEGRRRVGYRQADYGVDVKRGDKWNEALKPALRYAQVWSGREYTSINPKEARRRLRELRQLRDALDNIEPELERRATSAALSLTRSDRR